MNDVVLRARVEAETASARAGIKGVQDDFDKLKVKVTEASNAAKPLGPALMIPPAVVAATKQEKDALGQLSNELEQLRRQIAPAISGQELLAQAQAKVSAAVKAGILTQQQANAIADQARTKFIKVGEGSVLASNGLKGFLQQMSQVAQQGAVTGNYLGALSVQAADIGMAFGVVGIAIGSLITVAMPMLVSMMGAGKTSVELATEANDDYAKSFGPLQSYMSEATSLQDEYTAAVKSGSREVIAAVQSEARARDALLQLNILDAAQKKQEAQAAIAAQAAEVARLQSIVDTTNLSAFGADKQKEITAPLEAAKDALARMSAEQGVINSQLDVFHAKLAVNGDLLASIAAGTAPLTDGLTNSAGAAGELADGIAGAVTQMGNLVAETLPDGWLSGPISAAGTLASKLWDAANAQAAMRGSARDTMGLPQAENHRNGVESGSSDLYVLPGNQSPGGVRPSSRPTSIDMGDGSSGSGSGGGGGGTKKDSLKSLSADAKKALSELDVAVAAINEKVKAGLMSTADGAKAISSAKDKANDDLATIIAKIDQMGPAGKAAATELRTHLLTATGDISKSIADLSTTVKDNLKSAFVDSAMGAEDAFGGFFKFMERKLLEMSYDKFLSGPVDTFMNGVLGAVGGLFGGAAAAPKAFASGGVPDGASLSAHRNTVLSKATFFRMRGGAGVAGEAGREAIMPVGDGGVLALWGGREGRLPLVRGPGGRLGVALPDMGQNGMDRAPMAFARGGVVQGGQARWTGSGSGGGNGGGGMPNLTVNISAPAGHTGKVQQRMDGAGMHLDVMIEQIEGRIATNLRSGRGAMSGAISETYALPRATR